MILVTGASSFAGRHLCDLLVARGVPVRALVRSPFAASSAIEVCRYHGLDDVASLQDAVRGVEVVVHLAARGHTMRDTARDPLTAFRAVNVLGTRTLLNTAVAAGVRRFVLVSSVKAVGEWNDSPWTENTVPQPVDPYGVSKLEAEQEVARVAAETLMSGVSLRMPIIYGPGMKGNMLALFGAVHRGLPLPLGAIRNQRSVIFVGNAAAAILAAATAPRSVNGVYFVRDPRDFSTPELICAIAAALQRPTRLLPVPEPLFRALGRTGDLFARFLPVPLDSGRVRRLVGSLAVDDSRARCELGYVPPFSSEAGLAATARWFLDEVAR